MGRGGEEERRKGKGREAGQAMEFERIKIENVTFFVISFFFFFSTFKRQA